MIILYSILTLFILFFIVLNINALRLKKETGEKTSNIDNYNYDFDGAVLRFGEMIKCKTVSNKNSSLVDEAEYEKFRKLLPTLYPTVFEKCEWEEIDGGLHIKMKGKSSKEPSVLMAHFDVVSVNADSWSVDAFSGEIKDGFLWGRGTLDTKCTLFAIMESAEILLKESFIPENDIYFAFGCNEEIAGGCAVSIVETLKSRNVKPKFVLDEGGTILDGKAFCVKEKVAAIAIAEKGPMDVEFTVKGESGHSSKPPVHTAAGNLARDICKIENHQFPMKINNTVRSMLKVIAPYAPYHIRIVLSNLWCFSSLIKRFAKKNKLCSAMLRTSIAFTQLSASKGANVLPNEAKAVANVRLSQGQSAKAAVERMVKAANDPLLSARIVNYSEATPCADTSGKYWDILKAAVTENFENTIAVPYLMLGGTDSRFYSGFAENIYKFAPLVTSDELLGTIHSDDERIPLSNIEPLIKFFISVMKKI